MLEHLDEREDITSPSGGLMIFVPVAPRPYR
jgi:hypothetical protein